MKAVGTNTADRTSAMATSAPPTSSIVRCAASRGDMPWWRLRSTSSTTTIASSTTMPMARTSPNSESVFSEKPNACSTANVPMRDTGIATSGMTDARHDCRKRTTTTTTRIAASKIVFWTSCTDSAMNSDGL